MKTQRIKQTLLSSRLIHSAHHSSRSKTSGGDTFEASSSGGCGKKKPQTLAPPPVASLPTKNASDSLDGIQIDDPAIRDALQKIASIPEGANLLKAAKAHGLKSITREDLGGSNGQTSSDSSHISIAPDRSGTALIQTLAHELGHAATPEDGDSIPEEQAVEALGHRIAKLLTGQDTGEKLDLAFYRRQGLSSEDNGIIADLQKIGVTV